MLALQIRRDFVAQRQGKEGTYRDLAGVGLVLGVGDGAILLDDQGPATVAVTHAGLPTIVLGEEGLVVAEEVLQANQIDVRGAEVRTRTTGLPLALLTLPQAFMTKASLKAMM